MHTNLLIKKLDLPKPAGSCLSSPMLDSTLSLPSHTQNNGRDLFNTEVLTIEYLALCPKFDKNSSECNPLRAQMDGLAPLFVQVSEPEIVRDDGIQLAEIAKKYGVEVELDIVPHGVHCPGVLGLTTPEGREAFARSAAWIRRHH